MILQSLNEYYNRSTLAPQGWELKAIPFFIVIDADGQFINLVWRGDAENLKGQPILAPQSEIRSGKNAWAQPNFLWDHYGFILGEPKRKPNGEVDPTDSFEKALRQLTAFVSRVEYLYKEFPQSQGLAAISKFYRQNQHKKVIDAPAASDLLKAAGTNITFRLNDSEEPVFHEPWVASYISRSAPREDEDVQETEEKYEICLLTGKLSSIARLHPKISGVCSKPVPFAAANTKEAPAYSSYGKEQGFIFPISKLASFRYATALNHLLRKNSPNRVQVGDAYTVIWADRDDEMESGFVDIFGEPSKDDPDRNTRAVRALYEAVHSGKLGTLEQGNRFHVLGLVPNTARISVRFYHCLPQHDMAVRVLQYFEDIKIARGINDPAVNDPAYPSLRRLLQALCIVTKSAPFGDIEKLPPSLGGAIVDAIFAGPNVPYPSLWLNAAITRCRAQQSVTYMRAAGIKACLNRSIRCNTANSKEKEFMPMLDHENANAAYRLGRLFSVLERIQEESAGGYGKLNSTIRDRFYGAASSSPATVFPMLLKLKNHHVSKLDERARKILYRAFEDNRPDEYIGKIFDQIAAIPLHLTLQDQGRFALGYYHQRQAFFPRPDSNQQFTPEGN